MQTSIDPSVPNAGRVYDYVLGGQHNFEADRQAAEYMISLVPSTRKWVRMLRTFQYEIAQRLAAEGWRYFLDLASGLPTEDHIHSVVPDAKVVYVDNDPVTVAYAREILGDNPNVRYLKADIRDIDAILNAPEIEEIFGAERKVVIGFNGISVFLRESEYAPLIQALYDWAAPGSRLYATFETKNPELTTPKMEQFLAMFQQMGSPYYFITPERALELMQPWKPVTDGFRPIASWLGVEDQITEEDREGVELEFYGALMEK